MNEGVDTYYLFFLSQMFNRTEYAWYSRQRLSPSPGVFRYNAAPNAEDLMFYDPRGEPNQVLHLPPSKVYNSDVLKKNLGYLRLCWAQLGWLQRRRQLV
eukprot:m.163543 g.163543  ORF g.163543 m.163543 type:complete len:99 (-) comp24918_c0_seq1:1079-1375(-)